MARTALIAFALTACVVIGSAIATTAAAEAPTPLSGAEIREALTGATLEFEASGSEAQSFAWYFAANGALRGRDGGEDAPTWAFTWVVDGDRLCVPHYVWIGGCFSVALGAAGDRLTLHAGDRVIFANVRRLPGNPYRF